jgi:phage recombination protein Bet
MGSIEISTQAQMFGAAEMEVIKSVIAKGATDAELKMFVAMSQKLGLDPLSKQIHCVKRRVKLPSGDWGDAMTIVVGIDGYRLVADRTQRYCPGRAPTYEYDDDGRVTSATAYVLKLAGGAWHEVSAIAFWDEYAQTNKDGQPTAMWAKMPRLMLAKCAEALVLRRAFPAELSGVYTEDEMAQASSEAPAVVRQVEPTPAPVAQIPAAVPEWKADLIALGTRAKQAAVIMTPEEQQIVSAALNMAREVLKRNGHSTQEERDAATSALKQALGE